MEDIRPLVGTSLIFDFLSEAELDVYISFKWILILATSDGFHGLERDRWNKWASYETRGYLLTKVEAVGPSRMANSSLVKDMRGIIIVRIGKSSMIMTGKPIAAGRKKHWYRYGEVNKRTNRKSVWLQKLHQIQQAGCQEIREFAICELFWVDLV